ncbi:MAG: SAF domain-containing protein [Paenibacillaceae bacterium]
MSRVKNLWISLIAACLALLLVYGLYEMQLKQVEQQQTVQALVPVTFIPAGTIITEEMMKWKTILRGAVMEGMVYRVEDVVGMEALVPLGTNEPLLDWKLDRYHLLPTPEQATFQIPKSYMLSISSGIRAGDIVAVYVSSLDGNSRRLYEHGVKVASVKSAANIEIDDNAHSNLQSLIEDDKERMYASRRTANSMIDHINLNLTEEEWLIMDSLCKGGTYKVVIAFTSASLLEVEG